MASAENAQLVIGVDVGGTKVASGLVNAQGRILSQTRVAMVVSQDATAGLASVKSAIDAVSKATDRAAIRGIGICAPGPLDPKTGVIVNPPNVPCWRNFPLADEISRIYGVPVKVDNDANAAALAETYWGAGRSYNNIFYATIGTGIGTGIIFDRKIYHGRTGAAGEGGHVSIDYQGPICGCGKPGCVEVLAAGPAIARRAKARLRNATGQASKLLELAAGNIDAVTSEMVGKAYLQGDEVSKELLDETVGFLALWLSNMIDLLDPEALIIGGGVASMIAPFFASLQDRIAHYCVNSRCREIPLLKAHYGADSGIAGGAALCADL